MHLFSCNILINKNNTTIYFDSVAEVERHAGRQIEAHSRGDWVAAVTNRRGVFCIKAEEVLDKRKSISGRFYVIDSIDNESVNQPP